MKHTQDYLNEIFENAKKGSIPEHIAVKKIDNGDVWITISDYIYERKNGEDVWSEVKNVNEGK